MATTNENGIRTFTAAGAIPKHSRVKLTSTENQVDVAGLGASDTDLGTALDEAFAAGDVISVKLKTAPGTHKVIAGGDYAVAADVYGAASGKVSTSASGSIIGQLVGDPGADGDIVEFVYL